MFVMRRLAFGAVLALGTVFATVPNATFALGSTSVTVVDPSVVGGGTIITDNPTDLAIAQTNALAYRSVGGDRCDFNGSVSCTTAPDRNSNGRETIDYIAVHCSVLARVPDAGEPLTAVQVSVNRASNQTKSFDIPIVDHIGAGTPTSRSITFGQAVHVPLDDGDAVVFSATLLAQPGDNSSCSFEFTAEHIEF